MPSTLLSQTAANLVDDALAKVFELGTVDAMKWLAAEMDKRIHASTEDAARYRWLRAGHMEFGVQPDSDDGSARGDWFWVHAGDLSPEEVDARIDLGRTKYPTL